MLLCEHTENSKTKRMDDISSQKKIQKRDVKGVDNIMSRTASRKEVVFSFDRAQKTIQTYGSSARRSTLISRGKRTRSFYTEDSMRYLTDYEREMLRKGVLRRDGSGRFDSAQLRFSRPETGAGEKVYFALQRKYSGLWNSIRNLREMIAIDISPVKVWNMSLVGAVIFGMFSMTLIYRYLGQKVSAEDVALSSGLAPIVNELSLGKNSGPAVLGESTENDNVAIGDGSDVLDEAEQVEIPELPLVSTKDQNAFIKNAQTMVKGYPIEAMMPYILKQDKETASFLIAIAKKESNWGKRVPVLDGKDCYNYWGYRGIRDKMGTGGHTCFSDPRDAVETVAKRLKKLIHEKDLNTANKLIVWKCGSSCSGHSNESVRKWISDVDAYFKALNPRA